MGGVETFIWGFIGGVGGEVAVAFGIRHQDPNDFPFWVRSKAYYFIAILMVLIGGAVAVAYAQSGTELNAILAIQIGASAPLILRKARDTIPPAGPSAGSRIN